MFKTDAEKISRALLVWSNYIETGSVTLSSADMANQGKKSQVISPEQAVLVAELRELARKAQAGKVVVNG